MLVILTNIPTPYRTAFFNVLNDVLKSNSINFHVIYCAKTEPRRFWEFHPEENTYNYTFLPGWHPTFKNFYPHFNFGLLRILRDLQPRYLLVAGSWNSPATINVLINKKKINSKIIFWSEGHHDAQRSNNKLISQIRNKIFRSFDAFVVPNDRSRQYIKSFNTNVPIGFLPNTIDEEFYQVNESGYTIENIRKKYNLEHLSKIFICIATLNDRKGVFELIEAYNALDLSKKEQVGLIYVGVGDLMTKMKDYKDSNNLNNVFFLGHQSKEVVKDLLNASDIFVLPTKLDPNPLTPLEASFMKKPLILSKFAGNFSELLIQDKNGFGLVSIDKNNILNALNYFYTKSNKEISEMGENSYDNVKENFTRENSAISLVNFFKNL